MSDTEGALPGSGAHNLRDADETLRLNRSTEPDAPWLPTAAGGRQGEQFLPPAIHGNPIAGSETKTIESPLDTPQKELELPVTQPLTLTTPSTLDERLAAATLSGGLAALPAGFGDTGGDWVTVRSDNPFEVLYLDYRLADRITPEVVARHQEILKRFWQEKLKSMSQGAARLAIVKKYGGQHEAERLVHSYPGLIEGAYHRLSTTSRIEETYREIVTKQQKTIFARVDEKLNDFLVDSVLQPQETMALFEFTDREGLARDVVAAHVQDRIRAAGLVSEDAVSGATLEQQLLSSAWGHPSRQVSAQKLPVPQPRSGLVPLFLFSLAVVLVLVVGAALFSYRMKSTPRTEGVDNSTAPTVSAPQVPLELHQVGSGVGGAVGPDLPAPSSATNETPPRAKSPRTEEPRPQPEVPVKDALPAVSIEDRRAVQDELEEIRILSSTDPSAALECTRRLESKLAEHSQEFAGERVDLTKLRDQIQAADTEAKVVAERIRVQGEAAEQARQARIKEWEQSLAQIELLSRRGNFSAAKELADQLLSQQDLPEPIAERARKMADEAVSKLREIFSGAKVKSKTRRSSDPPQ